MDVIARDRHNRMYNHVSSREKRAEADRPDDDATRLRRQHHAEVAEQSDGFRKESEALRHRHLVHRAESPTRMSGIYDQTAADQKEVAERRALHERHNKARAALADRHRAEMEKVLARGGAK